MSRAGSLAVVGAGHLGSFHARALHKLHASEPRWVVDILPERARRLAAEVAATPLQEASAILDEAGAVIIATPTETHHELASQALRANCHVLVEKPMTETVAEAEALVALAEERGRILQVGHIERFNPVFLAAREHIGVPAFMEAQRLAPFVVRSLDIDVVLDLMIHDLDILLSCVPYDLAALDAVGVAVLTDREDIANAWLRFANGTVANLTASRVSPEKVRKVRLFGPAGYLSLDFLVRRGHWAQVRPTRASDDTGPQVVDELLAVADADPITEQLRAFLSAAAAGEPPIVSGADALRVQRIASQIQREVHASLQRFGEAPLPADIAGAGASGSRAAPQP
jgi:predicted dehydrogenase